MKQGKYAIKIAPKGVMRDIQIAKLMGYNIRKRTAKQFYKDRTQGIWKCKNQKHWFNLILWSTDDNKVWKLWRQSNTHSKTYKEYEDKYYDYPYMHMIRFYIQYVEIRVHGYSFADCVSAMWIINKAYQNKYFATNFKTDYYL